MKDYSKIKALAQSIIECIGDEPEGEHPNLAGPETPKDTYEGLGTEGKGPEVDFTPAAEPSDGNPAAPEKKKGKRRSDNELALLASTLASKFNK